MLGLIKGAVGLLKGWQIYAVVFVFGMTSGGWSVHKLHKAGERDAIEKILIAERESNEQARASENALHQKELEIAKAQVKVKEVIKYVKDNPECDIPPATASLLEAHRQGLHNSTGTAENTGTTAKLTQSREIEGHFVVADMFIQCRTQIIELNKYNEARSNR